MKPQDLQIEHLEAGAVVVQGWGRVRGRPFQFQAKHSRWTFAVFEDASTHPWDRDVPTEDGPGMCIIRRMESNEMSYAEAERIILRCADAYLFMIGRRQSDLSEDG